MSEIKLTREQKMRGVAGLTGKEKELLLPPLGFVFSLGPYVYKVNYVHAGKTRFSAELYDVKDDSEEESVLIKPTVEQTIKIVGK